MSIATLGESLHSKRRVKGLTHGLYRYPARFSPEFARAAIAEFTKGDDWILDPFVGGGTSAVEALAAGRRIAAIDINPLALLLTRAKTTPLYAADEKVLRAWIATDHVVSPWADDRLFNAPAGHVAELGPLAARAALLDRPRQRDLARALLMHVGQWALDGRQEPLPAHQMREELGRTLVSYLQSVQALVAQVGTFGLRPSQLHRRRIFRQGDAASVARGRPWNRLTRRFRLVLTSPPYPSVHVLYHRWQVNGRVETPMPYWLSDASDGLGEKHYTMGGRSAVGEAAYFRQISTTYQAISRLLTADARVMQLVSFNAVDRQLPLFVAAMEAAGYETIDGFEPVERDVPNRRWYYRVNPSRGSAREFLLIHRLRRP